MALRARPILIWISLTVSIVALVVWSTGLHRTVRCATGPLIGMPVCPPTEDDLAALAAAKRDAAEKSLRTMVAEADKARQIIEAAVVALNSARARQGAVEKKVRSGQFRLSESMRRLAILSTCDPAEPPRRDALARAVEAASADLARVRSEIAAARSRMICIKLQAEIEARERHVSSSSLHSREVRLRRAAEAETEQRKAYCREVAARSDNDLEDGAKRVQNLKAEQDRIAAHDRELATILARLESGKAALSSHAATATRARECRELKATLTMARARSDVDLHETSLSGLKSILKDSTGALDTAERQAIRAEDGLADIAKDRLAACQDVGQAAEQLEALGRAEAAAVARRIEAEHCKG